MNIFTIIVTYNAMRWIDKCLESLANSTLKTNVIVVDNMSTDETRNHIPHTYHEVVWIPLNKNVGFGQGNNIGIQYAMKHQADFILLLNQDAYINKNAIELMLKASDFKSLVVPVQLNGNGEDLDNMFKTVIKSAENSLLYDAIIKHDMKQVYNIGETGAACWFIPKSIIKEIGGFNPLFFQYGEDNNYYLRLKYHGKKSLLVPNAWVRHDRKVHGNMKVFNNKKVSRDLLLTICDINKSWIQCLISCLRILLRCYIYELPQKKYKPGTYLKASINLVSNIRKIRNSREQEKETKANWLKL